MGLKLKGQLLALFLGLFITAFGVIIYFNLLLSAHDNELRTEQTGHRIAELALKRVHPTLLGADGSYTITPFYREGNRQLTEALQQIKELRQFDVFTAEGMKIFGVGAAVSESSPFQQQAIHRVITSKEPFSQPWAYPAGESEAGCSLDSVGLFFRGWIGQEHYEALQDHRGEIVGIIHLSLEIPRAPLRMNLALLGNLLLACIFLISSALAFYLWSEFALNRPLRGLLESHERLLALEPSKRRDEIGSLISSNELANVSSSFNRLSLDVVKYQRELEEKTRRLESANDSYRQLNEQLEHKVEEKTSEMKEFFSLITHDLRIPLAAVAGYVDLLRKPKTGEMTDKQRKFLDHIGDANGHAQEMVRNLLDAMRYEFGQPQLNLEDFDISLLAHEITAHLSVQGEPVALEIPEFAWVNADRTRIGRVLGNLLGNAVRYASKVTLRIERDETGEEQMWRIEVEDHGPGIPPEHLQHLFDKFKHIQAQEGSSGLGLGLYIVKRIVADHGQDIAVDSQVGRGTRFSFRLHAGLPASAQQF